MSRGGSAPAVGGSLADAGASSPMGGQANSPQLAGAGGSSAAMSGAGGSAGAVAGGSGGAPVVSGGAGGSSPSPTPWLAFNYSPATRTLTPLSVALHGSASGGGGAGGLATKVTLSGASSGVTFDFGKEVAGIATLQFGAASDAAQTVSLSFSESSKYVGPMSDSSIGPTDAVDGALSAHATAMGSYVMPASKLRGGFRYLSVYLTSPGTLELSRVSLAFSAAPTLPEPNQYPNYFYSNDDLLNRIWYAGAYTVQLNTVDPKQGRLFPYPAAGTNWDNSATIGVGTSVIVDGAKRDRTIWPGDLGIALPVAYVSTGDLASVKNTLDTLFAGQDSSSGEFPRSGPPLNTQNTHTTSDTYHVWTLIGAGNYYLYSGDKAWLDKNYAAYKKGLAFSTAKVGSNGLFQVTLTKDWGRLNQGGYNIAANAMLYHVLLVSADMATAEADSSFASACRSQAAALKAAANSLLWDASAGAFRDNPTSSVYPQDGNSLAVWFGLVDSASKTQAISAALHKNWNSVGSRTPEGDPTRATISPFAGSMEVAARFVALDDQAAIDLIRLEWGYMLNSSIGTASTFWEGYLDDGSFGFGGSYMSAAHGWSAGPTFAMTEWLLGISPDSAAGQTYHVIPHPADLTHVEGSLALAPGKAVHVAYDHPACGDFTLQVDSSSNLGSTGVVGMPTFGQSVSILLNGVTVWDGTHVVAGSGVMSADSDAHYVYLRGLAPGKSVFTVSPKRCP